MIIVTLVPHGELGKNIIGIQMLQICKRTIYYVKKGFLTIDELINKIKYKST